MNDKQANALLGISRNMEKSLSNIEKSLSASKTDKSKALTGLSTSVGSLGNIFDKFSDKKASQIISFTQKLVDISNTVNVKSAKAFGSFASGVSDAFATLIDVMSIEKIIKLHIAARLLFDGKNSIVKRIVQGTNDAFIGTDSKKIKKGSEAIQALGEGLLSLSKALFKFAAIGLLALPIYIGARVTKAIISLFVEFGENAKTINEGGNAIKELGKGLLSFSVGLAAIALVTLIVGPKIIIAAGIIAVFGLTFHVIGKAEATIRKGAEVMALVSLALFGFAASLAAMALLIMIAKPAIIFESLLIIAGFALVFALIGSSKMSKEISNGALVLIFGIAVGLFFFTGAIMLMAIALEWWTLEKVALASGLILGLGFSIAIIGRMKGLENGVKQLAEMGLGLIAVSGGILAFGIAIRLLQELFKENLAQAGFIAGAILLGLGVAIGLIGKMPGLNQGIGALTGIGIGLAAVAGGILAFGISIKLLQMIFKDDLKQAGYIAGGIILGLGLAFLVLGAGPVPGFITAGAAAMVVVGFALMSISAGILLFGASIVLLQKIFGDKIEQAGYIAGGILLGLGITFTMLGLASVPIILGSAAALSIGVGLLAFSVGLVVFGGTLKLLENIIYKNEDGKYELKGTSILSSLAWEFSKVGLIALNPFFSLGLITSIGMGLSLLAIGAGISSAGKALKDLNGDVKPILDNIFGENGLITTIASRFEDIGKKYSPGVLGFLKGLVGANPVQLGMNTVKDMGDVLSQLAGGISSFANFEKFPIKTSSADGSTLIYSTANMFDVIDKLKLKLPDILSALAIVFSEIGNKFGGEGGWFGKSSPVQKGIDAVKGLGSVLSELAGGIVSFASFDKFPIQVASSDGSKLVYQTVDLTNIGPTITKILIDDGSVEGKGLLFSLAKVFAEIGKKYPDGLFTKGPIKKGIDAVKGIGSIVSEVAAGIIAFASLDRGLPNYDKNGKFNGTYTPIVLSNVEKNMNDVFNMLPKVMQKFIDNTKDLIIDDSKIKQLTSLSEIFEKFSKYGDGLKNFASGLNATGDSFSKFTGGFSMFAAQLNKFERFENAFSSLLKNQHAYEFDKFANSMGVLKTNINSFKVENLKLTDSLMKSLAVLSKSSDKLSQQIKISLEDAIKQLIDAIKGMDSTIDKASNNTYNNSSSNNSLNPFVLPTILNQPSKEQPKKEIDYTDVIQQIQKSIDELNNKIVRGGFGNGIKVEITNQK